METGRATLMESFHKYFQQLVKVSHPLCFLEYLQEITLSNTSDVKKLNRIGQICRPKKKVNLINDRWIHSSTNVNDDTTKLLPAAIQQLQLLIMTASCDVCLNAPCVEVASVSWGNATFFSNVLTLVATNSRCPVCNIF